MDKSSIKPRLIVHGGAGAISRENLPPEAYERYASKLLSVNTESLRLLQDGSTALDVATHAVRLLEDCPLFNCGKGSVFTRDGTIELEASVSGFRRLPCSVSFTTIWSIFFRGTLRWTLNVYLSSRHRL